MFKLPLYKTSLLWAFSIGWIAVSQVQAEQLEAPHQSAANIDSITHEEVVSSAPSDYSVPSEVAVPPSVEPSVDSTTPANNASFKAFDPFIPITSSQNPSITYSSLDVLTLKAHQGNSEAQYTLGEMYRLGFHVDQDNNLAVKWLKMAAEQGHVQAQVKLGRMFFYGEGVPQDPQKAVYWLDIAAVSGEPEAEFMMGVAYIRGEGVPKNAFRALSWLDKAYTKGHIGAQGLIGYVIYGTSDTEERKQQGLSMLRQACNAGRPESCQRLNQIESEIEQKNAQNKSAAGQSGAASQQSSQNKSSQSSDGSSETSKASSNADEPLSLKNQLKGYKPGLFFEDSEENKPAAPVSEIGGIALCNIVDEPIIR